MIILMNEEWLFQIEDEFRLINKGNNLVDDYGGGGVFNDGDCGVRYEYGKEEVDTVEEMEMNWNWINMAISVRKTVYLHSCILLQSRKFASWI